MTPPEDRAQAASVTDRDTTALATERNPAAPADDIEDTDPGLAAERTGLAWTRTAISFAALGGAILKTMPLAGVLILGMSALVWGIGRIPHRPEWPERPGRHRHLLITVTVTLVSVAALAMALLSGSTQAHAHPPPVPTAQILTRR